MSQSTNPKDGLKVYHIISKEDGIRRELVALSDLEEYITLAQSQTALNFATCLKHEFQLRDLSSDIMPKGARKLTNEELITKVWVEFALQRDSQPGERKTP